MLLIDGKRLYTTYIAGYVISGVGIYEFYNKFALDFDPWLASKAGYTALGISFGFVYLVEKYVWMYGWFRRLTGTKVPRIHGRWSGYVQSSFTRHQERHDIVVEFHQTLHQLTVWYYDKNAVTRSMLAGFSQDDPEGGPIRLLCIYSNNAINTGVRKLQSHSGAMELYVEPSEKRIKGIYYNNPHQRATYGNMEIRFASTKLRGSFD